MNDEVASLVLDLRRRSKEVSSFVATYHSVAKLELMPTETRGTIRFLAPDRYRAEGVVNNHQMISIRVGTRVETYLPQSNEAWKYDLKELPPMSGFRPELVDFRDPFAWSDEESLEYGGRAEVEGVAVHKFAADARKWVQAGMLDTRKGFRIPYRQKTPELRITLFLDVVTGIVRRGVVADATGKDLSELDLTVEEINVPLDEGLFRLEVPAAAYKRISLVEALRVSMDPSSADMPPSLN